MDMNPQQMPQDGEEQSDAGMKAKMQQCMKLMQEMMAMMGAEEQGEPAQDGQAQTRDDIARQVFGQ